MSGFGAEEGCEPTCIDEDPSGCFVRNRLEIRTEAETSHELTAVIHAGGVQGLGPGRISVAGSRSGQMRDVLEGRGDRIY